MKHDGVTIDIGVNSRRWQTEDNQITVVCQHAAKAALTAGLLRLAMHHPLKTAARLEISLSLSSDARIQKLNRAHRGQDKPTNVLSFPAYDGSRPGPGPVLLGDVVLAFETAFQEAQAEGKTIQAHTAHLVAHGVLHLLGYDHIKDSDAEKMEDIERQVLKTLGYPDPYASAAEQSKPTAVRRRTRAKR